ncbi:hypothetical protein B0H13DRAFT_1910474 [Mycena leptocephala]|nr:hypothetical protein B0H13DRAFT_1910474 [Mycena leptocephala]
MSGHLGANVGEWQATSSKIGLGMGQMTPAFSTSTRALSIDPTSFVLSSGQKVGYVAASLSTSATAGAWMVRCVGCLAYDRAGTKGIMWGGERRGQMGRVKGDIDAKPAREHFVGKGSTWGQNQTPLGKKSSGQNRRNGDDGEIGGYGLGQNGMLRHTSRFGRERHVGQGHRGQRVRATRAGYDGGSGTTLRSETGRGRAARSDRKEIRTGVQLEQEEAPTRPEYTTRSETVQCGGASDNARRSQGPCGRNKAGAGGKRSQQFSLETAA